MKTQNYDESKIITLSSLEHIRLRSGMYIGRLGDGSNIDDGIYVLIKEIIDNSIDEFIMGYGNEIFIKKENNLISIRDYGRGIPLGKVIESVSVINTGAKYNDDVFQFSVGLNGVGTKAVNALSSKFLVRSTRNGKSFEALFSKGKLLESREIKSSDKDGTYVEFLADSEIFGKYSYSEDFLKRRFFHYACLNKGLIINYNDQIFESKNGLLDFLNSEIKSDDLLYDIVYYSSKTLEFAFSHTNNYGETYFSFVNGQYTNDGGTHQTGFREGFVRAINDFLKKTYSSTDIREGLVATLSVKIKDPIFESQTKNKLGNIETRGNVAKEVQKIISEILYKDKILAKLIEKKVVDNERLRKELSSVRKEARERAKKISFKIPKLKDCKFHFNDSSKQSEQTMIFLTEGDSATGSMVSCRDVYTQAIFSLRGKPQNMFEKNKSEIYKNEELYNMMVALGIEESIENLRYNKVVIATDADFDGFHIRNLLLTFFLTFFEDLILNGHMYILETPLFRVRNKKITTYCYSEEEKQKAILELKGGCEVTRFKGLGEISPNEFKGFIDINSIKLTKVDLFNIKEIKEKLGFYMGQNTPERRNFIMENLI
ncbi:type IIA DNA topoisomerase subunit B [Borreliella burgdorferi]|uniref:DNA topoisomerase 4 subunit B n=3 Tax=Borreliella burgdorferi TaxID=139 RepID=PARE_BORBU|nr:DNA topoisomerase IV subunit B [Borreliella burgdorferi]Q59189.2 RecName: Full=DNA topoisomerase 4 subunit B; AltName: Full=Topoisomerase IV subunit B [Borreliella burgdorferi B31]AGS66063.1 DNA topoisomerase IV subunit B [Borreliella burgdorferi CA382]AAC66418.1 DNA topoisomerase II (N- region) domain protein [Borreliella burgdorferi B31]ACK75108.1 DNA topoisomerase II (N- region) domain protein [Borreliella burgdorferi ZS7]ARS29830.1 DNA topoisomerase 4 subunit B [Borreliella burgdorferi]